MLEETMNDTEYEIEYSKDKDAKVGHKTADTSFFGYKTHIAMTPERIITAATIKTVRGKRLFDVFGGTAIVDGFLSLLQSFLHYYLRPQSAINYTIIKSSKKNICCNDNLMNWLKDLNIEQKNL